MDSNQNVEPILQKENMNASDGGTTESTTDDDISTTSSDEALCDVLGLPSLSGMAMVDDEEEEDENEEDCGESLTHTSKVNREPLIPRRIHLPSVRGVSRKYHPSQDCFAYEIPKVLSPEECSELIAVAANSSLPNNHSHSHNPNDKNSVAVPSSFRYITHAIHTAPDGHTKFEVKLAKPNPHKLAVFRHESWVDTLWERLQPVLYTIHTCGATHHATTTAAATQTADDSNAIAKDSQESDTSWNHDSIPLPRSLDRFIQREKLSISGSPNAPTASPIAGLNPRLRVLKYDALDQDEFQGHFDATTEIHAREQTSYITVLLYLNDGGGVDFEGGETEFLSQHEDEHDEPASESETSSSNSKRSIRITPRAGSVVLFEHDLFHRGRPLLWGTKYVLRTDIMFANPPSQQITNDLNQSSSPSSPSLPEPQNDDDGAMARSTVEDVLHGMERELGGGPDTNPNPSASAPLSLLREALSEGLGFGDDLHDTSIECLCSPGRFALNLMLREHMLPASLQQQQQQQHHQRTIDRFLDASFEALKTQQR